MTRADSSVAASPQPVIRYMGNKTSLLPALREEIAAIAPEGSLVVDPMAGSHAVTRGLKLRHRILASDAQACSAVVGRAFVDNIEVLRMSDDDIACLEQAARRQLASPKRGFLETAYSDTWFGSIQCRELDSLRRAIDDVWSSQSNPRRDLALSAVLSAACRAQASPGHFAQFLPQGHPRTLKLRATSVLDSCLTLLRAMRVEPGQHGSRSLGLPWRELVAAFPSDLASAGAWYLDPPYTADQYSRFYHLLETITLGDEPVLTATKARYRVDRFRSRFCLKRHATEELRDLLTSIREASSRAGVVLSYSSRGIMSLEDLRTAAEGLFREAGFRELPHVYSTQGKGNLRGAHEWLLRLLPR